MDSESSLRRARLLIAGAAVAVAVVTGAMALVSSGQESARWAQFLGRFHPLVVHLPIGVLLLVALAEVACFKPSLRERLDPVLTPALVLLVVSAVTAFVVGSLLAWGGGYPEALLVPHMRFALAAVIMMSAALATWSVYRTRATSAWRLAFRGSLFAAVVTLAVGAHFGGSMTHGETYLVKYAPGFIAAWMGAESQAPAALAKPATPTNDPRVYEHVVAPVLHKYCVGCHGPDKTKGELRLDSYAALMKGGESGPAVVPHEPDKSRALTAMRLPIADLDHMPPEGKPQPSAAEVELLEWWVLRGADDKERVRAALPPEAVVELLKTHAQGAGKSASPSSASDSASRHGPDGTNEAAEDASEGEANDSASAPEPDPPAPVVAGNAGLVYEDLVAPLLAARCGSCHGASKQKGKLRTDSIASLLRGGKEGPALVAGNPNASSLVARARLPLDDDKHMPPKNKPQLTGAQLALLTWWIENGAKAGGDRNDLPANLRNLGAPAPAAVAERDPDEPSAPAPDTADGEPAESPQTDAAEPRANATEANASVAPAPRELLDQLPERVALFSTVIEPMLETACGDCHIGEPLMGDLSVASYADLMKSGTVVPGEPQNSELLTRVELPVTDDDRMPPKDMEGLRGIDVAALEFWILEGAPEARQWPREQLPEAVARAVLDRLAPAVAASSQETGDERARHAARVTPEGGCAACAVGGATGGTRAWLCALVAALVIGWRRERPSRRRRQERR